MPPRISLGLAAMAGPSRSAAQRTAVVACARAFTTRTQPSSSAPVPASSAMPESFAGLAGQLSAAQPCFGARGDSVELLEGPTVFHDRLLEIIKNARKRILISTLYIGTEEESLVSWRRGRADG